MKVLPLAAESLGVRSMATYVECGGTGLLLDPGATLAPSRSQPAARRGGVGGAAPGQRPDLRLRRPRRTSSS